MNQTVKFVISNSSCSARPWLCITLSSRRRQQMKLVGVLQFLEKLESCKKATVSIWKRSLLHLNPANSIQFFSEASFVRRFKLPYWIKPHSFQMRNIPHTCTYWNRSAWRVRISVRRYSSSTKLVIITMTLPWWVKDHKSVLAKAELFKPYKIS